MRKTFGSVSSAIEGRTALERSRRMAWREFVVFDRTLGDFVDQHRGLARAGAADQQHVAGSTLQQRLRFLLLRGE